MEVLGFDTYGAGLALQDLQQPQAANAGVAHAVDADFLALVYEDAVVPVFKGRPDRRQRGGVFLIEKLESPFGEHQAETECGIGRILLENFNLDFKFAALEQVGEIKTGRPGADDCDSHRHSSQVSLRPLLLTSGVTVVAPVGSERLAMISGGTG